MRRQRRYKKKIIIGLTGSFGSGKTTIAKIFASLGAVVIDADKLARQCLKPQEAAYKKIIRLFGRGILKKDKSIDRPRLAGIVFRDNKLLRRLNHIVHPEVIRQIKSKIKSVKRKMIVIDAPLLIEAGLKKMVDKLAVVTISRKRQILRLQNRGFLKKIDILRRINLQLPQKKKVRLADFIIDNDQALSVSKKQVRALFKKLHYKGGL